MTTPSPTGDGTGNGERRRDVGCASEPRVSPVASVHYPFGVDGDGTGNGRASPTWVALDGGIVADLAVLEDRRHGGGSTIVLVSGVTGRAYDCDDAPPSPTGDGTGNANVRASPTWVALEWGNRGHLAVLEDRRHGGGSTIVLVSGVRWRAYAAMTTPSPTRRRRTANGGRALRGSPSMGESWRTLRSWKTAGTEAGLPLFWFPA